MSHLRFFMCPRSYLSLTDLLRGFGFYFAFQCLFAPLLFEIFKRFFSSPQGIDLLFMAFGGFCSIGVTRAFLSLGQRKMIWNRDSRAVAREILFGIGVALLMAPFLMAFNGAFNELIQWMNPHTCPIEQPVVSHMREMISYPVRFGFLMSAILIFVPISEEFLFRGLLLSWLIEKLPVWAAVTLSSAIFAGFHFSWSVGIYNCPLLSSVFLLSIMLSIIYIKRGTLWATIGLHGTFNGINLLLLTLS